MDPNTVNASPLLGIFPLIMMSLPMGLTAYFLAREKGRKVVLWTILGFIPVINFFVMWFFVGAANLKIERKLDTLLERSGLHE